MCENTVLRRILVSGRRGERVTVIGGWRKLHNEQRRNLYSPQRINRESNRGSRDEKGTY
jgi:hypothetical protein